MAGEAERGTRSECAEVGSVGLLWYSISVSINQSINLCLSIVFLMEVGGCSCGLQRNAEVVTRLSLGGKHSSPKAEYYKHCGFTEYDGSLI